MKLNDARHLSKLKHDLDRLFHPACQTGQMDCQRDTAALFCRLRRLTSCDGGVLAMWSHPSAKEVTLESMHFMPLQRYGLPSEAQGACSRPSLR